MFARFGLPVTVETRAIYIARARRAPRRLRRRRAPCRRCASRAAAPTRVWDTLAIAETLAERHPEVGFWPDRPGGPRRSPARSSPRCIRASRALRAACPMNLRRAYAGFVPSSRGPRRPRAHRGAVGAAPAAVARDRTLALRRLHARGRVLRAGRRPDRHLRPAGRPEARGLRRARTSPTPPFCEWRCRVGLADPTSVQPRPTDASSCRNGPRPLHPAPS